MSIAAILLTTKKKCYFVVGCKTEYRLIARIIPRFAICPQESQFLKRGGIKAVGLANLSGHFLETRPVRFPVAGKFLV